MRLRNGRCRWQGVGADSLLQLCVDLLCQPALLTQLQMQIHAGILAGRVAFLPTRLLADYTSEADAERSATTVYGINLLGGLLGGVLDLCRAVRVDLFLGHLVGV